MLTETNGAGAPFPHCCAAHGASGAPLQRNGSTALNLAARKGHERVIELLLQHGAEVNLQDNDCGTALMAAAAHGHERVVELLLRRR